MKERAAPAMAASTDSKRDRKWRRIAVVAMAATSVAAACTSDVATPDEAVSSSVTAAPATTRLAPSSPTSSSTTSATAATTTQATVTSATTLAAFDPEPTLGAFLDAAARRLLAFDPTEIAALGLDGDIATTMLLPDPSPEAEQMRLAVAREILGGLVVYDRSTMSNKERVSVAALRARLEDLVDQAAVALHDYNVGFVDGLQANLPDFFTDLHPLDTPEPMFNGWKPSVPPSTAW